MMRRMKMLGRKRRCLLGICEQRFSILVCILILSTLGSALHRVRANGDSVRVRAVPLRLKEAVGCLVAANYVRKYSLPYVDLKVGQWAWVRYSVGSIPGIGDTPGLFNVVFYSPAGNRGILLFADPRDRYSFLAIYNVYHLHRHGASWTADYGNGGFHLYEAVGRFVTRLSRSPLYRVLLTPDGERCRTQNL